MENESERQIREIQEVDTRGSLFFSRLTNYISFTYISKLFYNLLVFSLFMLFSIILISNINDKFSDWTKELIDKSLDTFIDYAGDYFDNALVDFNKVVYNQRSNLFYKNKLRNLYGIDLLNQEEILESDSVSDVTEENSHLFFNETLSALGHRNESVKNNNLSQTEIQVYDFKYNLVYEFVKNLTLFAYKGRWSDLKVENNFFENIEGIAEVEIVKNYSYPFRNNYISNIEAIESLHISSFLKDGDYRDNYLNFNLTIKLPRNFSYILYNFKNANYFKENKKPNTDLSENDKKIHLIFENITIDYTMGHIFGDNNKTVCNKSSLSLDIVNQPKLVKKSFENQVLIEYPYLKMIIRDEACKFSIDLNLNVNLSDNYEDRIWNYSLIMTSISIIEIYLTLKLLYEVSENDQVGKNICLITLSINIMWNSFICTIHFYLSITNEDFSYEYGTPSMTYFLLFSIFELRLLFFAWRARHHNLVFTNIRLYRRNLMKFYSLFCNFYLKLDCFLFFGLLSIRYMFYNFWTCLLFFGSTWVFQIIHSVVNSTKPPYSMKYILMLTLGKVFAPLYIKACPFNIFELKPEIWKMLAIVCILMIQVGILALQQSVGPKFLVPSCLKKRPYNYYQDLENEDIVRNVKFFKIRLNV
jgi:hypothetical protein